MKMMMMMVGLAETGVSRLGSESRGCRYILHNEILNTDIYYYFRGKNEHGKQDKEQDRLVKYKFICVVNINLHHFFSFFPFHSFSLFIPFI